MASPREMTIGESIEAPANCHLCVLRAVVVKLLSDCVAIDARGEMADSIRIGIDFGGTKLEVIALAADGRELFRKRTATPAGDYSGRSPS